MDHGLDVYAMKSYSQEGEDLILSRVFAGQKRGLYVDVGAHHPRRFSNTHLFYLRGWSGINIEPNPNSMRDFRSVRPRDINLQVGISDRAESLTYYWFDDPALNTFDADVVKRRTEGTPYRVVRTSQVQVERLDRVLTKHLAPNRRIDFLTIDVEGHDYAVLRSNDWEQFRPRWLLVEETGKSLEDLIDSETTRFLKAKRYALFAKTYNTAFFRDRSEEVNAPDGLSRST